MPLTVASHWLAPSISTVVELQVTETDEMDTGVVTVTDVEPNLVESWVLVAVIVTLPETGTEEGAVYKPALVIVPESADQVTPEL